MACNICISRPRRHISGRAYFLFGNPKTTLKPPPRQAFRQVAPKFQKDKWSQWPHITEFPQPT